MPYKKCPRCQLNYIREEDTLCKICIGELGGGVYHQADEEEEELCPECGEVFVRASERMCPKCLKDHKQTGREPVEKDWDSAPGDDEADLPDEPENFDEDFDGDEQEE